jgi:hypothetical protein
MKKIISFVLAIVMMTMCLVATSCEKTDAVTVTRSFVAGYEQTIPMGETPMLMSGRVLMNLKSDGTLDLYVGFECLGSFETAQYSGTYTLGENEEFDEPISFTYTQGEGEEETVTDAVILDGMFETPFFMIASMTSGAIKFYETAPIATDGDVYVGYMTKSGGMGAMVYAYILNMKDDGTFDVSIMQMASVMHVWGATGGTYTVDGTNVTFTYDVVDDVGEVVSAGFTAEGTDFTDKSLSVGFNIAQASTRASAASFLRVN